MIVRFEGPHQFLSNFYELSFMWRGRFAESAEHHFQAAKTDDEEHKWKILHARSPGMAKRLGRKAPLRDDWDETRLSIMESIVRTKFQNPNLRVALIATGDRELIEGNWWGDTYWGMCKGVGENHLGKILMKVRAELHLDSSDQERNAV